MRNVTDINIRTVNCKQALQEGLEWPAAVEPLPAFCVPWRCPWGPGKGISANYQHVLPICRPGYALKVPTHLS
jgi:hypothetical protein